MYNIIDGYLIHNETRVPVIAISYHESSGLTDHIIHLFEAEQRNTKLDQYSKIGERDQIVLRTGKNLFIRVWGINCQRAVKVLRCFHSSGFNS